MTLSRDRSQRVVDLLLAGILLIATAPAWPLIAVAVRLDSPGPVIFRGRRMGRGETPFDILKFRTMVAGGAANGRAITVSNDARITRVGRLLRLAKLDELPQLINVLRGEMSMVGWRPEDPRYRGHYTAEMAEIFAFRPGITGPASLAFRHEEAILAERDDPDDHYVREVLPAKVAMDLAHCRAATLRSDLRVLVLTVRAVARRHP